ncbi:MAG: M28 family peptidase [Ignavibacteria bacterium]|nr:M28 family peptidase [Ignavibacteria bacterium]
MNRCTLRLLACSYLVLLHLPSTAFSQAEHELAFARRVSQRLLLSHVRDLVQIGNRFGGTPSGDSSAAYIHRKFSAYGVKSRINPDPERITYAHKRWLLRVHHPRSHRKVIKNEWLAGYSPSTPLTICRVTFLDVGERIDPAVIDSGAILTPRFPDHKLYAELVKAGVRAILWYPDIPFNVYENHAYIGQLPLSKENLVPLFNISAGNGKALRDIIQRDSLLSIEFLTQTEVFTGSPKTVVAEIKGKSDQYFMVCAHGDSDSGGPGADDNASGMAGVLEVARVLRSLIRDRRLPQPEYSIRFIVWGSEYFSSDHYVRSNSKELDQIKGVINFDQIGTGATRNCVYFESNEVPHNRTLLKVLEKVGEDYAGRKGFWEEATTNPSQGGTDSYVFLPDYLSRIKMPDVKIPSTTMFTGAWNEPRTYAQTPGWSSAAWKGDPDSVTVDYSEYYHSSMDIPRLTTDREPFNMAWAVKATGIALLRLAWEPQGSSRVE